jgi:hypothetical protein
METAWRHRPGAADNTLPSDVYSSLHDPGQTQALRE